MAKVEFTENEKIEIREIYGKDFSELNGEEFEKLQTELRKKYHPDKFEQYNDAVIREMAKEKFQRIEKLGEKLRKYMEVQRAGKVDTTKEDIFDKKAQFAFEHMSIEIITREKDLKYLLFGTYVRWLEQGDEFQIPKTQASIIMDQDHRGVSVGFVETIKIYLSFGPGDNLDMVIQWLYEKLKGHADAVIVEGKRSKIDLMNLQTLIRRKSFLGISAG